jgi:hypothetical protein
MQSLCVGVRCSECLDRALIATEKVPESELAAPSLGGNSHNGLRCGGRRVKKKWDELVDSLLGIVKATGANLLNDIFDEVKDNINLRNLSIKWDDLQSLKLLLRKI